MACIIDAKSTRGHPARLAAGLAIAACLALGTFAASANAQGQNRGQENHDQDRNRGQDKDHDQDNRGRDQRDGNRGNEGWGGNYYNAPPVVYYQTPSYYAPPPVVYGPGFGININLQ
jgi:Ni/Co efflux regulator RcnB